MEEIPWEGILRKLGPLRGWVDGVCFTGGEPTRHAPLGVMMREVQSLGFQVKLDTNGSHPEVLERLIQDGLLHAVSMDIKAPLTPGAYARCAGRPVALDEIKMSLRILARSSLEVEFRTTVVPGLLDEADLLEIARDLPPGVPYRLQGFRPQDALDPSWRKVPPLSEEALERMIARVAQARSQPHPRLAWPDPTPQGSLLAS
jgi:pyruvate formate lyase activating enzyme